MGVNFIARAHVGEVGLEGGGQALEVTVLKEDWVQPGGADGRTCDWSLGLGMMGGGGGDRREERRNAMLISHFRGCGGPGRGSGP